MCIEPMSLVTDVGKYSRKNKEIRRKIGKRIRENQGNKNRKNSVLTGLHKNGIELMDGLLLATFGQSPCITLARVVEHRLKDLCVYHD